ncbi:MAG TPA: helix-turn-helix domain-containing protein [Gemmataceae bacterium]|nr:helix-turn-helix domain-containing protein [Gemmataceae bacterium]
MLRNALREKRKKVFHEIINGIPHDGNAKARIWAYAKYYNAKHRSDRQHRGPMTWATQRVLKALLYKIHNSKTGRCFPKYETIAEEAECCRDTVYQAINVLFDMGILDWENRFDKIFKNGEWQYITKSNAYLFRDPWPCAMPREVFESENPPGTLIPQEKNIKAPPKIIILDPQKSHEATLISFGKTLGAQFG